ncbi:MAG: ParB/RepB/Spo0J family partition protein [bacterium]|nr:ParB/RepB/Spo0J family partition protein [bacterium]
MKPKVPSLGRGLSALIPGASDEAVEGEYRQLPIAAIEPNPLQPRRHFDETSLQELAASIKQQGVLQPLLVEEPEPGVFRLLAGERRLRAAKLAGLTEVPIRLLQGLDDGQRGLITLIENLQREDLDSIEFANGCQKLLEQTNWTHDELAKQLGRGRSTITNTLRILTLPEAVQESIRRRELSEGHGRALLGAQPKDIPTLWRIVLEQTLNVRQTEALVQKSMASTPKDTVKRGGRPTYDDPVLRNQLEERLGCQILFAGNPNKGKIVLQFQSVEQREVLVKKLLEP